MIAESTVRYGYYSQHYAAYRARILHAVDFRWSSSTVETNRVTLADEWGSELLVIEMPVATMVRWVDKNFHGYAVTVRGGEMIDLELELNTDEVGYSTLEQTGEFDYFSRGHRAQLGRESRRHRPVAGLVRLAAKEG